MYLNGRKYEITRRGTAFIAGVAVLFLLVIPSSIAYSVYSKTDENAQSETVALRKVMAGVSKMAAVNRLSVKEKKETEISLENLLQMASSSAKNSANITLTVSEGLLAVPQEAQETGMQDDTASSTPVIFEYEAADEPYFEAFENENTKKEPANREHVEKETAQKVTAEKEAPPEEIPEEEPAGEDPEDMQPDTEEPADEEPVDEEPAGDEPIDEEPGTEEPATDEPVDEQPAPEDEPEQVPAEEPVEEPPVEIVQPAQPEPPKQEPVQLPQEEPSQEEPQERIFDVKAAPDIQQTIRELTTEYGFQQLERTLYGVINIETGGKFNPEAKSHDGYYGLLQMSPYWVSKTATKNGINRFVDDTETRNLRNARDNILTGLEIWDYCINKYGLDINTELGVIKLLYWHNTGKNPTKITKWKYSTRAIEFGKKLYEFEQQES